MLRHSSNECHCWQALQISVVVESGGKVRWKWEGGEDRPGNVRIPGSIEFCSSHVGIDDVLGMLRIGLSDS